MKNESEKKGRTASRQSKVELKKKSAELFGKSLEFMVNNGGGDMPAAYLLEVIISMAGKVVADTDYDTKVFHDRVDLAAMFARIFIRHYDEFLEEDKSHAKDKPVHMDIVKGEA